MRSAGHVAFAAPFDGSELFGKFKHVVVIVQENRTPDNLFNGLPGADTVRQGRNSQGQYVNLQAVSLSASFDIEHTHKAFSREYARGNMNGFDLVGSHCGGTCPPADVRAYGYVKSDQTRPYFDMAEQYAFADRMFESNQGPSFPAHLYIVSGSSKPDPYSTLDIAENPRVPSGGSTGGCDSPPGSLVALIDEYGNESDYTYPCSGETSIFNALEEKQRTWHYYQAHGGSGLWNAADALRTIRYGSGYDTDVTYPPTQFYKDVKARRLADVSIVTPTADNSDHAGITNRTGPSWVASVVNAVGKSAYWNDTAIFVTWDDWGGWYDHVAPQIYNSYELGFRVPLIVISPYTPRGYVSHTQHEFGSILKFIEEDFGLESLGTTDARADDLADCFDFQQQPRRFVHIDAPRSEADFLRNPGNTTADVDY
jgi:phospholipase C